MRSWARSFELNKKREARFFNTIHVATIRIPHPFVLICSNEIHWSETPAVRNYLFHCVGRYWCSYVVGRGTYEANEWINQSINLYLVSDRLHHQWFIFIQSSDIFDTYLVDLLEDTVLHRWQLTPLLYTFILHTSSTSHFWESIVISIN